jgi:hypothetical protein
MPEKGAKSQSPSSKVDQRFAKIHRLWIARIRSVTDLRVFLAIASYADADGTNSYPSAKSIADVAGLTDTRSVRRSISNLVAGGFLVVDDRRGGRNRTTRFVIPSPTSAEKPGRSEPAFQPPGDPSDVDKPGRAESAFADEKGGQSESETRTSEARKPGHGESTNQNSDQILNHSVGKPTGVSHGEPPCWFPPIEEIVRGLKHRELRSLTPDELFGLAKYHAFQFARCTKSKTKNDSHALGIRTGLKHLIGRISGDPAKADLTVNEYVAYATKVSERVRVAWYKPIDVDAEIEVVVPAARGARAVKPHDKRDIGGADATAAIERETFHLWSGLGPEPTDFRAKNGLDENYRRVAS